MAEGGEGVSTPSDNPASPGDGAERPQEGEREGEAQTESHGKAKKVAIRGGPYCVVESESGSVEWRWKQRFS